MALNQQTLRGILAAITSVNEAFIVPKQGNWWNPQEQLIKPDTWCAYLIRTGQPRTLPFYIKSGNTNSVTVEKITSIDLQFVGPQSEDIANSVAFWPMRDDVKEELKKIHGALLNDDLTARSSPFYQDGSNGVTAWNVTIRVIWYDILDTTQGPMPPVLLDGKINQK